ncbi:ABC transporter substrate-binding protein [Enterococcus faecalis]
MKKIFQLWLLASIVLLTSVACGNRKEQSTDTTEKQTTTSQQTKAATRTFVDSADRKVQVPVEIKKIAPSGSLAQLVLYTSSPDLLVGLSGSFAPKAQEYIPKKYQALPVFGQFYGKSASLNMEALSAAAPDVIIDIGEVKKTIKEDMDKLQDQLAIPTIFIEANLKNMGETYQKLGELLGNTQETEPLSHYCQQVITKAEQVKAQLPDSKRKSVYYAAGKAGLNTNAEGSFHAQVLDEVGVKNVVTGVDVVSTGAGTTVSMEQLLQWQPDYILAESKDVYRLITTDAAWQELTAVKEGRVYQVPTVPYNFLSSPPSVNRMIGIQWLGQLIYPEQYQLNLKKSVAEFYDLFYHTQPNADQLAKILVHAQ